MKNAIAAAVICSPIISANLLTPVLADEMSFASKLVEVTVYPRGAQVTRVASGQVPTGDHVIMVEDLPGQLVANSVRVEGSAAERLEIGSVDVRQSFVADHSVERVEIEDRIESINDEIAALGLEINNANTQHRLLQVLAGQTVAPRREANVGLMISAEELNALLNVTSERFAAISKITEKARIRQRLLTKQVEDLRQRLNELSPEPEMRTVVAIYLDAVDAGEAEFRIRYKVDKAGWTPLYDARLLLGTNSSGAGGNDARVKIVRRANVRQATTEPWDNVALTLSTARPKGNTQSPKLSPYILSEYQKYLSKKQKLRRQSVTVREMAPQVLADRNEAILGGANKPDRKIKFKNVAVEFSGFLAEYKIAGPVSVTNAGAEKNVTIGSKELSAIISAHSTPKIDPGAYLNAKFKIEGEAPWLPGPVMLSRDRVFLGRAILPLLNPGQEYSLGFGRDDFVKIDRVQVTDKKGESGLISTANVEERKFVTTITNRHDFPMRVIVQDQVPYATHEDIEVKMSADTTKPSKTDVDKKRGILEWEKLVEAKAENVIEFGYKVSWPKTMNITPVQ
jgi:uncharacterized protein (TIGR02231 family)